MRTTNKSIRPDKVAVPHYFWKILYIKKTGKAYAHAFRNDLSEERAITTYEVSLDSVQHLSGLESTSNK